MTEPIKPATRSDHATHDPVWMAALAAKDPDLTLADAARAQAALESCTACADLFADLVAVSAAIPSAAIPARPRDFTLTPADAARLRSRGLRRWFSAIGSARDGITFPLALGLTTMGIAGLLLATVPSAFNGAAGGASQVLSTVGAAVPAAGDGSAPAASAAPERAAASAAAPAPRSAPAAAASPGASESTKSEFGAMSAAPSGDVPEEPVFNGDGGDTAGDGTAQINATDVSRDGSFLDDLPSFSVLAVVAGVLLLAGLGLFVLRWTARRIE
jgi:hypothetical protein